MRSCKPVLAVGTVVACGVACGPVSPPPGPDVTTNNCPDHPCSAYAYLGAAPECVAGACLVSQAPFTSLALVVDVPEDSAFAPGQTYLVPFDGTFLADPVLPLPVKAEGTFVVSPNQAVMVGWNLGNPGFDTALPMQATFRRFWGGSCASAVAADSLGLPTLPVEAESIPTPGLGPNGGPALAFETALQPGCYEQTIMPIAPFDTAFPPDVEVVDVKGPETVPLSLDTTSDEGTLEPAVPLFTIDGRLHGTLDGFTAYLRDATTRRRISNLGALSGAQPQVQLATDHHPNPPDALQNAQLVVAPPAGAAVADWITAPIEGQLGPLVTYPMLPPPVSVQGKITSGGEPAASLVVFEATSIYANGRNDSINFEFVATATTAPDDDGNQAFAVVLPPGEYQVTVRPNAGSAGEVTVVPPVLVNPQPQVQALDAIVLPPERVVSGIATLADGRLLVGATVDALPTQCSGVVTSSTWCLPRSPSPTTTDDEGTFSLTLDDGAYLLRVRPAEGTGLPWVVQPLLVTPSMTQPNVLVPAPFYAGFTLSLGDSSAGSTVTNAVVRVFDTSSTPAAELAQGFTDANGHVDIYLAPPTQ